MHRSSFAWPSQPIVAGPGVSTGVVFFFVFVCFGFLFLLVFCFVFLCVCFCWCFVLFLILCFFFKGSLIFPGFAVISGGFLGFLFFFPGFAQSYFCFFLWFLLLVVLWQACVSSSQY